MVAPESARRRLRRRAGQIKRGVVRRIFAREDPQAPRGYAVEVTRPRFQCLVCGSEDTRKYRVVHVRNDARQCRVKRCQDCGFVQIMRAESNYRSMTDLDDLPPSERAGKVDLPGREFHMAKMALDMIGGHGRDVLLFGVGRSMDNLHLEALPETGHVAVGDIMKVRDDVNFIDLTQPATRTFDIVVASEVVEHFRRPRADFDRLLEFVKEDGLLVAGTNIHDGRKPLAEIDYIFYPDHTAFYSPEALRTIARARGWLLDFRPTGGTPKRYVLMSRSLEVMQDVACYFGREPYAPSELERPSPLPPQRTHAKWREPAVVDPAEVD